MARAPRTRAVKKERKHYHLDWTVVPHDAARVENLVVCHLLKWVHFEQDTKGREVELRYFRDVTDREVDFVVVEGRSLHYLKARFPPGWRERRELDRPPAVDQDAGDERHDRRDGDAHEHDYFFPFEASCRLRPACSTDLPALSSALSTARPAFSPGPPLSLRLHAVSAATAALIRTRTRNRIGV